MGFWPAFLILAVGTAGLYYLDRDKSARIDKALWLPVVWFWIIGSRPPSTWMGIWFGIGESGGVGLDAQLDGNMTDALVFLALLLAGGWVLYKRKRITRAVLKASLPLLIYFSYCALSCLWSPFPDVAFKRWIKDVGELTMILVVVTDADPIGAMHRLFSRVGFVLLPASIFLMRYSSIGLGFNPDGSPMNTGVTTNKNTLGLIAYVVSLGVLWSCIALYVATRQRYRTRKLVANLTLLAFGIGVLYTAHSATSIACFLLGGGLIAATYAPFIRRHPKRIYALVLTALIAGGVLMLSGGESAVVGALGRDTTLTGRTDIWKAAIPACPNPLIGAGFESFWNGYGKKVDENLPKGEKGLNSAHNGYIEVYLNLGWCGVGLIAFLLITGFRSAVGAFQKNQEIGSLMLAFIVTAAMYSISEAGFRILTPTLISVFLAIVASRATVAGLIGKVKKPIRSGVPRVDGLSNPDRLASAT